MSYMGALVIAQQEEGKERQEKLDADYSVTMSAYEWATRILGKVQDLPLLACEIRSLKVELTKAADRLSYSLINIWGIYIEEPDIEWHQECDVVTACHLMIMNLEDRLENDLQPKQPRPVSLSYRGIRTEVGTDVRIVTADGTALPLHPLDMTEYSSWVMNWGHGGSSQLALAILANYMGDDRQARSLCDAFMWNRIAPIRADEWTITSEQIAAFMDQMRKECPEAFESELVTKRRITWVS